MKILILLLAINTSAMEQKKEVKSVEKEIALKRENIKKILDHKILGQDTESDLRQEIIDEFKINGFLL